MARVKSKRIETSICSIINIKLIKLSKPIFGLPMTRCSQFAWQDCSKLFTSCSKFVLLQNCSKLVDNKLVLTSWLAELYLLLYSKMFEQLGKGLLKQTTSCLLEQLAEKLSSELLCKQIRSNKLCSVSGLTNLQHFLIVYGVATRCINRIKVKE